MAVMSFVDGYTQDEIATSLGVSRKTVGKVIRRVTEQLHKRGRLLGYVENTA